MSNQLRSFPLKELKTNRFCFTVSGDFEYLIDFHQTSFNLPISIQHIQLYEFSFVARNKPDQVIGREINVKIRNSIFEAIDYFLKNSEGVLMYICDSSDKRERVRQKLFTERWYTVARDSYDVDLVHRVIEDEELGDIYYTGILMKKDFEWYDDLINEFEKLALLYK